MSKLIKTEHGHSYTSSNGRITPLPEMAYTHLSNALVKAKREGNDDELVEALEKELSGRPAPEQKDE